MYTGTLADDALVFQEAAMKPEVYPVISDDPCVQSHYLHCRAQGTSHALAEMFAHQTPPQPKSDREFLAAQRQGKDSQFSACAWKGDYYKKTAEAAGADVTGKVYLPGLARYPGDHEAFVDGVGDVRRVVEQRGWGCEGAFLNIAPRELENPPEKAPIAKDIVYDKCLDMIAANPDLAQTAKTKPRELMDQARELLAPNWDSVKPKD